MSWSSRIGSTIGLTLSGPPGWFMGHLVGGLAGKVIEQQIGGFSPVITKAFELTVGEATGQRLQEVADRVLKTRTIDGSGVTYGDALEIAYFDACIAALWDIGGPNCFPAERGAVSVESEANIAPEPSIVSRLWHPYPELAAQVCDLLRASVDAIQESSQLHQARVSNPAAAGIRLSLQEDTSESLARFLYEQLVAPYLQADSALMRELRAAHVYLDLEIQRMLFERVPVHLARLVKNRTDAWRAFNEIILDGLNAGVAHLLSEQAALEQGQMEILRRLDRAIDNWDSPLAIQAWSDGIAALLAELGQFVATQREGIGHVVDEVLTQLVSQTQTIDTLLGVVDAIKSDTTAVKITAREIRIGVTAVEHATTKILGIVERLPADRTSRLQAMLVDTRRSLGDLLERFVGRANELRTIRERIKALMPTGGDMIITADAGHGKSSVMAKLVEEYGFDAVAYHFIDVVPGRDYEIILLRNILAQVIIKYHLNEIDCDSENLGVLSNLLPGVLTKAAATGRQVLVFIDGLDQLEVDQNGGHNLSFVANLNPQPGVVIVVSTRPNEIFKSLERVRPVALYSLPCLSFDDFGLMLLQRDIQLDQGLRSLFYHAMHENALYLGMAAEELAHKGSASPSEIIQRVTDNPDGIFSLALERLNRHRDLWNDVIYPLFGLFLATREPFDIRAMREILSVTNYQLRAGLQHLGGLVTMHQPGTYALFHSKFRSYLQGDERQPTKECLFSTDEVAEWHKRLAAWCEHSGSGLAGIWIDATDPIEQFRRVYARNHYVTHIYLAREWDRLWKVLDGGEYGRSKVLHFRSTHSYAQDLDLGRQAAARKEWGFQEGLTRLSNLWRYSLLRCSMASLADNYPEELFPVLVSVGQEQEAIGLAELVTSPLAKTSILARIGLHLAEFGRELDGQRVLDRASEVASAVDNSWTRSWARLKLVEWLARAGRGNDAFELARLIELDIARKDAARHVAQAGCPKDAIALARTIRQKGTRADALCGVARVLVQTEECEWADELLQESLALSRASDAYPVQDQDDDPAWKRGWSLHGCAEVMAQAGLWERAVALARGIEFDPARATALRDIAAAMAKAGQWESATGLAREIKLSRVVTQVEALSAVAKELARASRREEAAQLFTEALEVARGIEESNDRSRAIGSVAVAMADDECWEATIKLAREMSDEQRQDVVKTLAQARRWKDALVWTQTIEDSRYKSEAMILMAEAELRAGELAMAQSLLGPAMKLSQTIEDTHPVVKKLVGLTVVLLDPITRTIKDGTWRPQGLGAVAVAMARARSWDVAIRLADSVTDKRERAGVLGVVAVELMDAHESTRAMPMLDKAIELALAVEDNAVEDNEELFLEYNWRMPGALGLVAVVAARNGRWEDAFSILSKRMGAWEVAWAFQDIVRFLVGEVDLDQILKLVEALSVDWGRAWALQVVAEELAKAVAVSAVVEVPSEAIDLARAIEDDGERNAALHWAARVYGQARRWNEAVELAQAITDSAQRATALGTVALMLAQAGERTQARPLLNEAVELAQAITDSAQRATALGTVALMLAQAGERTQARPLLSEAVELAQAITDSAQRAAALGTVALMLAQVLNWHEAIQLVEALQDESLPAGTLRNLRPVETQTGEIARVLRLLNAAADLARSIGDDLARAEALGAVAKAMVQIGQRVPATPLMDEAVELAQALTGSGGRARALGAVALALVQAGELARAMPLINEAMELAQAITERSERERTLRDIAEMLAKARRWDEARHLAWMIKDSFIRAVALRDIVETLAQAEQWTEAVELARKITDPEYRVWALRDIIVLMVQAGKPALTMQLLDEALELAKAAHHEYAKYVLQDLAEMLQLMGKNESTLQLVQESWLSAIVVPGI